MEKLIESLSQIERTIIPHLHKKVDEIVNKTNLDKTTVIRALTFLESKGLLKINQKTSKIIDLGVNGIHYKKNHLPERKLLITIENNNNKTFNEIKEKTNLSDNEFKAALGVLKNKLLISLENGKLKISSTKEECSKKFPEELLLEKTPITSENLSELDKLAVENLKTRKDILEILEKKDITFELTEKGKEIAGKQITSDLIEELTPEIIKEGIKNKKFRRYDFSIKAPSIYGGKKHFVNQSIEQGKKIWLELGFKEMTGDLTVNSFWNFDALFTAQDHPVREMHDTFFIKDVQGKLPEEKTVQAVKKAHEQGVDNSTGWKYNFNENESKKVLLRTHTTCLSAKKLASLKKEDLPAKFFSVNRVFRNETLDWKHGFEFNQAEGIVIDPNANFRHLIGYLKEFAKKMGHDKIRIQPSYFPYTEPSLEGSIWNNEKKEWVEVLAAGIFRPEVTIPLLGTAMPVLAWGPGFDRLMTEAHKIKDLRELYKNDINHLREHKILIK
ncbi:phenylalanine--tRNA ligase subunit alpha [Candidatus Pacearchaeota archaeon]|nr:phenylalanine--tRNA ligase subunit alpha [Candidatus Pacearchaeota archaeon]